MAKDKAPELSMNQLQVLNRLSTGDTITDAAKAAGVSRAAVHDWLRSDVVFVTEWNKLRFEFLAALRGRINVLAARAVETLEDVMADPKIGARLRLQAAMKILAAVGALKPEPIGSTRPGTVRQKLFLENHFE